MLILFLVHVDISFERHFLKFVMQLIAETLMSYVNNVGTIYDFRRACKK